MNLNKILQKGLYSDVYLDLPYHNRLFADRHQLNINSYNNSELFEYHIKVFGLTKEYNKFKKEQLENNNSVSPNLLDEKDLFILNIAFDIILTARYQLLKSNIFRADFLYTLKKLNLLNEFWKKVDLLFNNFSFLEGRNYANELLKENFLEKKRVSAKILDLNDFLFNKTKDISRNIELLSYIDLVKKDGNFLNSKRSDIKSIKELYNNNYVNKRIISIDLKTAFYQSSIIYGIIPNIPINDLFLKYSNNDLLINNKPLRQVVFGSLTLKSIGSLVSYSNFELYNSIREIDNNIEIYIHGEDELIIVSKNEKDEFEIIKQAIDNVEKNYHKLNVSIEIYDLLKINTNYGEFFFKSFDDGHKVIKGTPMQLYPQVYKLLNNKRINKKDFWFMKDDKLVTLTKTIKIVKNG